MNIEKATSQLEKRIAQLGLAKELRKEFSRQGNTLLNEIANDFGPPPAIHASASGIDRNIIGGGHRLSKGSLFELAVEAVLLIGAFASVLSLPPAAIAGLGVFLYRYRRSSADVDEWDALILNTLKHASSVGMTVCQIRENLPVTSQELPSATFLTRRLEKLKSVRLRSGEMASFVDESNLRWWAKRI